MHIRPLVAFCGLATLALSARDAGACTCGIGDAVLLSPAGSGAPLNAHIRIEGASQVLAGEILVRERGGAVVATTESRTTTGSFVSMKLVPRAALAPHTRYEVAQRVPGRHPPLLVFGSFETGDAADTTAPRITRPGIATPHSPNAPPPPGMYVTRSTCSPHSAYVMVDGLEASDPGRAGAHLLYAVWSADASGRVDDTKPPAVLLAPRAAQPLTIGRTSICDPHTFAPSDKGVVVLGIAAIDEAGNKSATQTLRVDMSKAVP